MGGANYFSKDFSDSENNLLKACEMFKANMTSMFLYLPYFYLSMLYTDLEDYQKAVNYAENALLIALENRDKFAQALSWGQLGIAIGRAEPTQCDRAEKFILKALEFYDSQGLRALAACRTYALGNLYIDTNQREKLLRHMEQFKQCEKELREMGIDFWHKRTCETLTRIGAL